MAAQGPSSEYPTVLTTTLQPPLHTPLRLLIHLVSTWPTTETQETSRTAPKRRFRASPRKVARHRTTAGSPPWTLTNRSVVALELALPYNADNPVA